MSVGMDPRDTGERGIKEWEEFRASYAAAFVLTWLLDEAREDLTEYARDLHDRFMSGWDIQDVMEIDTDSPPEHRGYPLPPRGGVESPSYPDELVWMENWEAQLMYDQLFPHRESVGEFADVGAGLAVVALHAALETYLRAVDVHSHGPLPKSVEGFLRGPRAEHLLDSETMRWLVDCDATRHLVVHHRGVVTERYIRDAHGTSLEPGELRRITSSDLRRFAQAIWRTASTVRSAIGAS